MKEIEANFNPSDDAIDRQVLNEIIGDKAEMYVVEKLEQTKKFDDQEAPEMNVSGRSLLAGPSIGEYDTSKKSVEKVNELELAPMRSPKLDG